MDYFTSDTHFNHFNIIGYCNRPFKDVNQMNHTMVNNWNEIVKPEDTVYHLGDFALSNKSHWSRFVKGLNGYKIIIKGNHDKGKDYMLSIGFDEFYLPGELTYQSWTLVHEPIGCLGNVLCGHVHEKWVRHTDGTKDIINVGVDQWNFKPQTLQNLLSSIPVQPPLDI